MRLTPRDLRLLFLLALAAGLALGVWNLVAWCLGWAVVRPGR